MKNNRIKITALVAVFAGVLGVFIAKSNEDPSTCFTWKVKINGSVFYLAGSNHAANEKNYPLPEAYLKGYKRADKVIFELEDNFEMLEKKIFEYAEKDKLPDELNFGDSLSPMSIKQLKEIFTDAKLEKYFKYEGWLLNMFIAGHQSIICGYDSKLAIDKYFHDLATKDKKEIFGLDKIQTQLALFDFEVPFKMQVKIIEKAVSEMATKAKSQEVLFQAYFANDMTKLEEEFLKPFDFENPQMQKMYDRVFTERNTKWVEKLEELSKENPCTYFVLVGVGHYFGPNNILELLKNKGYTIEKV